MRVILYEPDYGPRLSCSGKATAALSEGLTTLGVEHSVCKTRDFLGTIADVAIVNGWTKTMLGGLDGGPKKNRNTVIAAQEAAGKPAWCLERGFLLDREEWSSLAIGGFCASGDFRAEGMPPDRWIRMGVELQPWRTEGNYILLCGQVPWDAQVEGGDHIAWLEETAREIRKHTDREIWFRPHPKAYRRGHPYEELSEEFREIVGLRPGSEIREAGIPFEEDLAGAHAVVCYNSNVATLATVAGVPVFTGAPSLADPIAFRIERGALEAIETKWADPDREQWSWNLAYHQWRLEEFREALPYLHLTR